MPGLLGARHYGELHYGEGGPRSVGDLLFSYLPYRIYAASVLMRTLMRVDGSELDYAWAAFEETRLQPFLQTTTWRIGQHEQTLGLPVAERMTLPDRRARALKRRSRPGTHLDYLTSVVQDTTGQAVPPTVILSPPAMTTVFKLASAPFPTVNTLLGLEDHLSVIGRQGTGHAVAGIALPQGLTFAQMNVMQKMAVQVLSVAEIMGTA